MVFLVLYVSLISLIVARIVCFLLSVRGITQTDQVSGFLVIGCDAKY